MEIPKFHRFLFMFIYDGYRLSWLQVKNKKNVFLSRHYQHNALTIGNYVTPSSPAQPRSPNKFLAYVN
jgi:hypothetical protein